MTLNEIIKSMQPGERLLFRVDRDVQAVEINFYDAKHRNQRFVPLGEIDVSQFDALAEGTERCVKTMRAFRQGEGR